MEGQRRAGRVATGGVWRQTAWTEGHAADGAVKRAGAHVEPLEAQHVVVGLELAQLHLLVSRCVPVRCGEGAGAPGVRRVSA